MQGATDVGPNADSLPGYYGLVTGAWQHWCRVWNIDYEWLKSRFASQALMERSGITVSRWIDGVLDNRDALDQGSNIRAMFYLGHAPNSQTRGLEMKMAMDKLDLLVVIDPYPSATAAMAAMPKAPDAKYEVNPNRAVYLLPATSQFESEGSVTASNRSLQWREKVIDPLFESRADQVIMYAFAQRLRLRRPVPRQEGRAAEHPAAESEGLRGAGPRGRAPERDQPRLLDDRLHRADAGTPAGAHAETCTCST